MIHVFTAYKGDDWTPLADIVLPRMQQYCEKHGYCFHVHIGEFGDGRMAYPMQKTAAALSYMESSDCVTLAVLDLDILILDYEKRLLEFVDDKHDIFVGNDINGLNSGIFLVNNNGVGRAWLWDTVLMNGIATSENHAMQILATRPTFKDKVKFVEGMNQIPYELYPTLGKQDHHSQLKEGDWMAHLPGMRPDDRCKIFTDMLQ